LLSLSLSLSLSDARFLLQALFVAALDCFFLAQLLLLEASESESLPALEEEEEEEEEASSEDAWS